MELVFFQSNHEGELVDMLHKHIDSAAGAILNPAGLTQFGVSLHDAIKTMPFPVIEVHISNRHAREEWRHHSIISPAAKATVEGWAGAPTPRRCARWSRSAGDEEVGPDEACRADRRAGDIDKRAGR